MASILIVEARFYDHLNDLLLAGARAAIEAAGHNHETVTVPGALEVPGAGSVTVRTQSGVPWGAFLAKKPFLSVPSGNRWNDIGRSATCGRRYAAIRA